MTESDFWKKVKMCEHGDDCRKCCWESMGLDARKAHEYSSGAILLGREFYVCHRCDNPPCCNPNHLWIGTCRDNQRDRSLKLRARKGWKQIREYSGDAYPSGFRSFSVKGWISPDGVFYKSGNIVYS